MLLALDTSTSAITVALHDGSAVAARACELDARSHGERLAPLIQAAFDQAGVGPEAVTAVVVGEGPGPFTGLRVGLVSAAVFAWARGLPAYGLCSLDALAWQAMGVAAAGGPAAALPAGGRLLVATDARRKEVYWATYDVTGGLPVRLDGPAVGRAAALDERIRELPAVGRGPELYGDALNAWLPDASVRDVDAGALAELAARRLAGGETLSPPTPRYLRRPDAQPQAGVPPLAGAPA